MKANNPSCTEQGPVRRGFSYGNGEERMQRLRRMSDLLAQFFGDIVRNILFRNPKGNGELRI